jgi:phage FluMu protein Com
MLTLKCADCNKKLFKYRKTGKGRVLRCWKERIVEDYAAHDGGEVRCVCGKLIGTDEGAYIKMKGSAFTETGTRSR